MCYSAQIVAEYKRFVREFGAVMDIKQFFDTFWRRKEAGRIKIPKAVEASFQYPQGDHEREISSLVDEWRAAQETELQRELFKQSKRLADAQRVLQTKSTKKAQDDQRIATSKIGQIKGWLADLQRTEPKEKDSRIYPGVYAPVMVSEAGQRVVRLMRYQCRPAGKPASYDVQFAGTYNARRDNLEGFWRGQFGRTHGLMLVEAFYENVTRIKPDGSSENVVLEFLPADGRPMLVACLWSHWVGKEGEDLWSFAAITDEPPPEVAVTGHDRCIIPIKAEHIDAWLNPDPKNLQAQYAIFDDRERPYYEHRLAA